MQVWDLAPGSPAPMAFSNRANGVVGRGRTRRPQVEPSDVLASLVDCIGGADFATRALAELNRALPVAWWTVCRVEGDRPPLLCAQASHAVPDIALDCWQIYRSGVWREDAPLASACDRVAGRDGALVMSHCVAGDFGAAQRERIYTAHSLSERLSILGPGPGGAGGLLAVNLYRHRAQAGFDATAIDEVLRLAAPLLAVVRRHLALAPARHDVPAGARLLAICPALSMREREVCEGLLRGWSFDGVAEHLALSVATVKTYRNRAFARLGIHHRNELFGLCAGWQAGPGD